MGVAGMKRKDISLHIWLRGYWIAMGLIMIMVYFLGQSQLLRLLTDNTEKSIGKSISIASNGIEDSLEIVDSFIYEALYSGSTQSTSQLYNSLKYETDMGKLSVIRQNVVGSLQSIVTWSDMIDFILLYTEREDEPAWLEAGVSDSYQMRSEIKQFILKAKDADGINKLGRYMIYTGESRNCMLRLIKIEGSYLVIGVSGAQILATLQGAAFDSQNISFAADEDGKIIFATSEIGMNLSPESGGTYVSVGNEEYLQTGYVSEKTGYYFGTLTKKDSIVSAMWIFRWIFIVLFLLLIVFVPLSLYLMSRYVEKPIKTIADTMKQIAEGELDLTVEEKPQILELAQLVKTFNHMIAQIKTLKIEKYEGKLEAQRATMQYLQLQIKPHFYANVLSTIYTLAERKDYRNIQKISSAFVNFSRYMFHDANELVEMKRELEHVHYYMEIQEMRYMMQIECTADVPQELQAALIPPFAIQSFVENSMKHAFSTQKSCRIKISAKLDREEDRLLLTIRDNGPGYSDELLNTGWDQKGAEGHIGLTNVYKRLKLIYEEKADIKLYNDSGAVAVIQIPYIAVDNMQFEEDI